MNTRHGAGKLVLCLVIFSFVACSIGAVAQSDKNKNKSTYSPPPPRPSPPPAHHETYNPPPSRPSSPPPSHESYNPPPRPSPPPASHESYNPPPRSYSPPPAASGGSHNAAPSYNPAPHNPAPSNNGSYSPPSPPRTYSPGGTNSPSRTNTPPTNNGGGSTYSAPHSNMSSAPAPPPKTYTPGANSGGASRGSVNTPSAGTTYKPGANSGAASRGSANTPSSGTTYTPHSSSSAGSSGATVYTPKSGAREPSPPSHSSGEGVSQPNGVVTYTPHSSGGSGNASAGMQPPTPLSVPGKPAVSQPATRTVYSVPSTAVASTTGKGNAVLTASGSSTVVHEVNSARAGLTGINRHPIPAGQVTTHANGGFTVKATDGRQYAVRSNGTLASYSKAGTHATFTPKGHVQSLQRGELTVTRTSRGQRVVTVNRPNHTVVVSTGHNRGYVQHTVMHNGHQWVQRTYVAGGRNYTRAYTTYTYRGAALHNYVPRYYYAPDFYGWAYYPWARPVAYSWGWIGSPWYAWYGPYFVAWPSYSSPTFWLAEPDRFSPARPTWQPLNTMPESLTLYAAHFPATTRFCWPMALCTIREILKRRSMSCSES